MKPTLLALLCFLAAAGTALTEDQPRVPTMFLQTTIPVWQRILATEISADFHATPLNEAVMFIVRGTDANMTVAAGPKAGGHGRGPARVTAGIPGIDLPANKQSGPPTVTLKLVRIPLRTALYLLARDSDSTVTWELMPNGSPSGIIFTLK